MAFQIPKTQKAAVIENPGPKGTIVVKDDVPVSEPGPNEILVKLEYSGLCRSEIRALLAWGVYNHIVGHEGIGTVVKAGDDFGKSLLGRRVGVKWLYSACGNPPEQPCSVCRRGFPNNCPRQRNTGKHVPGTLQQYVIADARYVTTRIPAGLASEAAAPLLCAGLTMMGGLAKVDTHVAPASGGEDDKGGIWVVISGAGGGLGHLGVQLASSNRAGRYNVIAIDSGKAKRALSLDSGAHHFIDYKQSDDDIEKAVHDITGGEGAHAVLVVSGSEDAFRTAPRLVRNMGIIVSIGLPHNDFTFPVSASLCSARSLTVTGVAVDTEQRMEELLELAASGKVTPAIEVRDFVETPAIIEQLRTDNVTGRIVVKIPEQAV
ncbi:uncharacterized protein SPSK_07649 [Sporothrix schenckii 1099-18]|uniref:Enoyl reductase (ER) domain-containing protein n=1 Tax=Sporothrix schenckii 1099-18 TaxID=1397361 RepID=A0A0F2MIW2_SPOSC|nr:uncharacterized protein SPSK_07649 [Sporothrix schenckii 1099-18]KJR88989.1 hypothetical protein SPSK_07649 [Sporothrix schenckii 1099-18]